MLIDARTYTAPIQTKRTAIKQETNYGRLLRFGVFSTFATTATYIMYVTYVSALSTIGGM